MKILIFNRRDSRNPVSGGAEVYTHQIARGLVERGNEVTHFSCAFKGCLAEEDVEGIRHIRKGSELTVHFHGFLYALRNRREFDLIVDQFNGLGFFCFLLPRRSRVVMLIHQMYREFWFRELGPAGAIPYLIEPLLLKLYRRKPAVTVSDSTSGDLMALGFRNVHIVMNALSNTPREELAEKEQVPTLMFLGRLRATKRPEDAVEIFKAVKRELPDARLWMVGTGPDEEALKKGAEGVEDITFFGWCDDERKFQLLQRAHVLLVPGVREGFGINVIEAASQGTPAVGYDIHGLRDSIRDGETGLLAQGTVDAAEKALALLRDPERLRAMSMRCLKYANGFNWRQRAGEFWQTILKLFP
jgi:glycosyltransferase involved in cell wall biosynthesis